MDVVVPILVCVTVSVVVSFLVARHYGNKIWIVWIILGVSVVIGFLTQKPGADQMAHALIVLFMLVPAAVVSVLAGLAGLAFRKR